MPGHAEWLLAAAALLAPGQAREVRDLVAEQRLEGEIQGPDDWLSSGSSWGLPTP